MTARDGIGPRLALLCPREAFYGVSRFGQFVGGVGATEAVVATRLKELVPNSSSSPIARRVSAPAWSTC